jgi:alpha/beta superfamily hydrolase
MGAKACFAAGFSFGTTVIAEYLVQGGELEGALLVAPPLSMKQMPVFALPRRGMSMFLGEKDEFCDPASLAAYAQSFSVAVPFTILPAAEHYFHGHLPVLAARIQETLQHTLD